MASLYSDLNFSTFKLLLIFVVTISLMSVGGPLASHFQLPSLPSIPRVYASSETGVGLWYPSGAQEQTLSISQGDGSPGTQVGWLLTNQVDAEDWPLTATQQGLGSGNMNCSGNIAVLCSLPIPDQSYYEIQFNLANVLWGIPMQYGNGVAGQEVRQGIAHLINKQSLTTNNANCLSVACIPNDQAMAPCTTNSGGCVDAGLPAANPCGWDTKYAEASTSNCVVGSPGGTSYNCCFSTVCPTGTVVGTTTFAWQAQIGSADFCAAAQHFITAFADAGITGVTTNASCELVAPLGGWPSVVTAINSRGCGDGHSPIANTCIFTSSSSLEARKSLAEGLAQNICALFSPAWGAWTTLAGQSFDCNSTNTGTGNAACGGGACPFLQEVEGFINQFCGFVTSTTGIPNNCWGIYTGGYGKAFPFPISGLPIPVDGPVFPFDSTTYFVYNGIFTSKTTVTCVNADCSNNQPGSTCTSTTYNTQANDYMYICSQMYDSLTNQVESSTCLASPSITNADPTFNQAAPTFANCSGSAVSGGAGATTCIGASPVCSAVSAGYQAEDYYGSHAFTIPVWSGNDIQARLRNWALGGSTPGFITAFDGGYSPSANYFEWLNAYSASPAIAGTFRQSFITTVDSLDPWNSKTVWDAYALSNIYDGLFVQNPMCSLAARAGVSQCSSIFQYIDWMTTSHSFLCQPGGTACTSTSLGYGNSTYFANTVADLRLTLNHSNHWHDGGPVTAWDVKYSFIDLNATGAFQATALANVARINVIDEFTLDINLKSKGPFAEFFLGGITIMPGHIWSVCGASTWNGGVTDKNVAGTTAISAPEDACVGAFGAPSIRTDGGIRGDSPLYDPVANNVLIGSGPYACLSIGGTGHPAVGTIGGGCSIDNTQAPALGLGDFTLTRTGCTETSSGPNCDVAGSGSDYFRSSGRLALYIWSGDIGSGSADFSKVLTVQSCHSSTPSANCPHWAQGIGNPSATSTSNLVGVS